MNPVVIIGAGITGLSAAWELQQRGIPYLVLEASGRVGGKLITEHSEGFLFEAGADSFLLSKQWAWQLCQEIGLAEQMIPTNSDQRAVYVYHRGALHPFPKGMRLIVPVEEEAFLQTASVLSEAGKQRMLAEATIPPRQETTDESLAAFVRRRFGQEALEVFGESLLSGIHVADPEQLSVAATFPQYPRLEHTYGSVIRGMRAEPMPPPDSALPPSAFVSPKNGMAQLPETLASRLTGDIRLETSVVVIGAGRTVRLQSGEVLRADAVIVTTPAGGASKLLAGNFGELSALLGSFKTVSSGTVHLGYRERDLDRPLDGYGFVIPRSEPTRITACTWSSTKLSGRAPDGYALLRVFIGGHGREAAVALSDAELVVLARRELQTTMGLTAAPVITRVYRWQGASPQYEVGHLERVARIAAESPAWLKVTGCAYDGVGVPDCVRQGRAAAQEISESFSYEHRTL
jgi:oxygen-dependent protoporphyrinogen oxidase